jgi:hypothetical protein
MRATFGISQQLSIFIVSIPLVILLATTSRAGNSQCLYGVDGICVPKRASYGYHQVQWRPWPIAEAKEEVTPQRTREAVEQLPRADVPGKIDEGEVVPSVPGGQSDTEAAPDRAPSPIPRDVLEDPFGDEPLLPEDAEEGTGTAPNPGSALWTTKPWQRKTGGRATSTAAPAAYYYRRPSAPSLAAPDVRTASAAVPLAQATPTPMESWQSNPLRTSREGRLALSGQTGATPPGTGSSTEMLQPADSIVPSPNPLRP